MSITALSGPFVVFGQSPYAGAEYNPDLGSSLFWGGTAILDPRPPFTYVPGEAQYAPDYGWYGVDNVTTLNVVPYTLSATAIAAAATTVGGTAMTLVSAASTTTGVAIIPSITRSDTGVADTNGGAGLVGLDSYTSVSGYISNGTSGTAGNTLIVSTASNGPLLIGMTISGTGITAGTTITGYGPTVNASNGASATGFVGSYTVSGAPVAAGTSGSAITITASFANGVQALAIPQNAQTPSIYLWNPQALLGRAVTVTGASGATSSVFTIRGYDIYGYPMTENISGSASTTATGKKAFKFIKSVTPATTSAGGNYSVGTSDVIGLPLRADFFGELVVNAGASLTATTLVTAATGFVASDQTFATATTGDVRGTYALQTASSTAANRYVIRQTPQPYNVGSIAGLVGTTQFANF